MKSEANTVADYLAALPDDRKAPMHKLVEVIRQNLPAGFAEVMGYGMPGWVVPHSIYPAGYHCDPKQPLPFLSLASAKSHISLYHMGMYGGLLMDWFIAEWNSRNLGKLDMGKSCIRFKKPELIPFDLIGELVKKLTPAQWITHYELNLKK